MSYKTVLLELFDKKLSFIIKHQDNERQAKIIAHSRDLQNKNKMVVQGSNDNVLWDFLLCLPGDMRYLAFLRNYIIKFSAMYRPMKTQNIVPESAEVFEACMSGDALGVKLLLDSGRASPQDITPDGSTALEVVYRPSLSHSHNVIVIE